MMGNQEDPDPNRHVGVGARGADMLAAFIEEACAGDPKLHAHGFLTTGAEL
jgi:hypothetical protein